MERRSALFVAAEIEMSLFSLDKTNPAFPLTTVWGNMIPRKGDHFSYPVEVGVAYNFHLRNAE